MEITDQIKHIGKDCVHFENIDRGIECTAVNCPCDLYETREKPKIAIEDVKV